MKKILRISLFVIIGLVLLVVILNLLAFLPFLLKENVEPHNRNLNFVGENSGHYYYGGAFQNPDGSVFIVASLTSFTFQKNYISLMKLKPDAQLLWETKTNTSPLNRKGHLPSFLFKDGSEDDFQLRGLTVWQNEIYVLASDQQKSITHYNILEFDLDGNFQSSREVNLELDKTAGPTTLLHNGWAYICYRNHKDKMLCLAKLDLKTGQVAQTVMMFYKKLRLQDITFAADDADSTVYLAATDYVTKASSFFVSKQNEIKEYFRNRSGTHMPLLKYLNGKLYGVVREDSLLQIIDLSNLNKPQVLVTDKPALKNYQVSDLAIVDGSFCLALNCKVEKTGEYDMDVVVKKYKPGIVEAQEFLISGRKPERANQLFATPDKQLLVLGTSASVKPTRGLRIFASRSSF
jgi:hypothetical protein